MFDKIIINKESSPSALEEKIIVYINQEERAKYYELLKRTWPSMKVKEIKKYA